MKLAGRSYLEILEAGGGIMSTVRAVRAASEQELTGRLLKHLAAMAALGTATAEVKSGYGLTTADELKMLRAIHEAAQQTELTVVASFLGAHAIDPDNSRFVEQTIDLLYANLDAAKFGAGADPWLPQTHQLRAVLKRKQLPHTVEIWPAPADHHERWWKGQLQRFLEHYL